MGAYDSAARRPCACAVPLQPMAPVTTTDTLESWSSTVRAEKSTRVRLLSPTATAEMSNKARFPSTVMSQPSGAPHPHAGDVGCGSAAAGASVGGAVPVAVVSSKAIPGMPSISSANSSVREVADHSDDAWSWLEKVAV